MLFEKSTQGPLTEELFKNPPSEYRGAPFWAWNTRLTKERLEEQIHILKQMGMGGFHIHSRIGLDTEFMGDEFLDCAAFCEELAEKEGMLCWLYDEDKWPSGAGGGRVTRDPAYRNRFLLFSREKKADGYMKQRTPKQVTRLAVGGEGRMIARYEIQRQDGYLTGYRMLSGEEEPKQGGELWYAYLVTAETSPWFNNQAYPDTLNPRATEKFIAEVHEKYYEKLGQHFAETIPAIFTDEPQFSQKDSFSFPDSDEELKLPFTEGLEQVFWEKYGYPLLENLPELFWEPEGRRSKVRYDFHDCVTERFASSYCDVLGNWCLEHHLMLTGHVMEEAELGSQTRALGEVMRQYRAFGLPGVDMLANRYEYNTVKQAQSASHQYGCPGVASELYGVTNWDFGFLGHKLQGDWMAALGVTNRVHHLSWLSMKGEAKRDYPAPIDEHSPWYEKYHLIEDYFARITTVLTRGKALVRIGVIHPIESYWLADGPVSQTWETRQELEENFTALTNWLLFGQLDFDFVAESAIPKLHGGSCPEAFDMGKMSYDVIVVPPLLTIRRTTWRALRDWEEEGGKVLWMGKMPGYLDAERRPDVLPEEGIKQVRIPFSREALYEQLEPYREVEIRRADGSLEDQLLVQLRKEGNARWVFIAVGKPQTPVTAPSSRTLKLMFRGHYQIWGYCPQNGEIKRLSASYGKGKTILERQWYEHDSLLLKLEETEEITKAQAVRNSLFREKAFSVENTNSHEIRFLRRPISYQLSEPNALLLDMPQWQLLEKGKEPDGERWQEAEEVLQLEEDLRTEFGWTLRTESFPQPWLQKQSREKPYMLYLSYRVESLVQLENVKLALEDDGSFQVFWNGEEIFRDGGSFVDACLKTYAIKQVNPGENTLLLKVPFGESTQLEWCYLLGGFGVCCSGVKTTLTQLPKELEFGDFTRQLLPFYGGNLTYCCEEELKEECRIAVPNYRGALVGVRIDGGEELPVIESPYQAVFTGLSPGRHKIQITLYGNRYNQFGQLHNCDAREVYFGPKTWRTRGAAWSREYCLKPMGILSAPFFITL